MLAAQQLGAPLKQLNDAQRAEAQGLLTQVQGALRQVASSVLQDPRLALTRTHQQQGSRALAGASRAGSAASSQQQQQDMLTAAAGMAPTAVRELQGRLPLAAVCVKALQGFYWGLDAFQADFASAVDAVRCVVLPFVCLSCLLKHVASFKHLSSVCVGCLQASSAAAAAVSVSGSQLCLSSGIHPWGHGGSSMP
jgi:hypothetical protein